MDMEDKQTQDIETIKKEIICMIEELYECKFIGKLDVKPLYPIGYSVAIDLLRGQNPIFIDGQLPRDKFLKYIYEELRMRGLDRVELFGLYRVFPND